MLALLFAMLATGCASQNAMSLVPDSVKMDMARDKAAKSGPLSVESMLAKARDGKHGGKAGAEPVNAVAALPAEVPVAQAEQPEDSPQAQTTDSISRSPALDRPWRNQGVPTPPADEAAASPSDLFNQAMQLQKPEASAAAYAEPDAPAMSVDELKAAAAAEEWRKILAQSDNAQPDAPTIDESADTGQDIVTAALPQRAPVGDIVGVNFNENGDALLKDDDLKVRLLRHGNRYPDQIVVGKVEGVQGFEAMQKALALGKVIADACGGDAGISYDPSLSAGSAELHYATPGNPS